MLVLISVVVNTFYTAVFNTNDFRTVNLLRRMAAVFVTFMLWCTVNWGFTTLTDNEQLRDIFIYSAYALSPIVLIMIDHFHQQLHGIR